MSASNKCFNDIQDVMLKTLKSVEKVRTGLGRVVGAELSVQEQSQRYQTFLRIWYEVDERAWNHQCGRAPR